MKLIKVKCKDERIYFCVPADRNSSLMKNWSPEWRSTKSQAMDLKKYLEKKYGEKFVIQVENA